jgi:uncharacterized protein
MALANRGVSRRGFLKGAAALSAGAVALPALQGLGMLGENGRIYAAKNAGYGDLTPTADLRDGVARISLPPGFKYRTFSVSKNGETMDDGNPVPLAHDGMAGFFLDGTIRLIRNHEDRNDPGEGSIDPTGGYDELAGGGNVTLEVDPQTRELVSHFVSQNGTIVNCAGGATPWNSWITCEETNDGTGDGWEQQHGYCFEVPVMANFPSAATGPYTAMGRFAHEAIAVDPSGIVYETEDNGTSSGFYRYIPNSFGDLTTGLLQMLAITGIPNYDTTTDQTRGVPLPVTWVTIADPDPPLVGSTDVFDQGAALGGASFARLEGCWYGNGSIFFNSTSGGNAGQGQVWEYKIGAGTLTLIFESPSADVLNAPDNLTVSPSGALLLCEDGSSDQFLRGVTLGGEIFDFSENLENGSEWAGATFVKHGNGAGATTLFVNRQGATDGSTDNDGDGDQGMTFAIWGPWNKGSL